MFESFVTTEISVPAFTLFAAIVTFPVTGSTWISSFGAFHVTIGSFSTFLIVSSSFLPTSLYSLLPSGETSVGQSKGVELWTLSHGP